MFYLQSNQSLHLKENTAKQFSFGCILEGNTVITGTKIQSHREKNDIELVSMRSW